MCNIIYEKRVLHEKFLSNGIINAIEIDSLMYLVVFTFFSKVQFSWKN
jgi:hypothetical protein